VSVSFQNRDIAALIIGLILTACPLLAEQSAEDPNEGESPSWSFTRVQQRAEDFATRPFITSRGLPEALEQLDYDRYRLIKFRHEKAIWRNSQAPFWLEGFHRGYLYRDAAIIHLVENGHVKRVPFDRQLFRYPSEFEHLSVPNDLGFAGFRVLGRFARSPHPLEIASFLGTSYFRAIGEGQVYGTSARGLAINIGLTKAEEFPEFREFWIERPEPAARQLRIWALLDSPSVTGAYEFVLRPGATTIWEVTARLFFRRQPEKIGLAPLSSMWMWGDGRAGPRDDPRPKVHDADGLLIWTNDGEWVWRPLGQTGYPSLSHYDFGGIRGFGLMQRDRRHESYRDDLAEYHLRPSVWIEPLHDWSAGAVELLEFPAKHEGFDSIAAWWTPREPVRIDKPLDLHYTVSFMSDEPQQHVTARAVATRVVRRPDQPLTVEIEFAGRQLAAFPADAAIVPEIRSLRGTVTHVRCRRQPDGNWQLRFDVQPAGSAPIELHAVLKTEGRSVSESWRYLCPIY
jgi:periplasmic glucans biosynthesis protein